MDPQEYKKMKIKMKVFQLTQEYFRILGINIGKTTSRQIKLRNLTTILVFFSSAISTAYYFFYESETFIEYITAYYLFCCVFNCLLIFLYVTWITPDLFEFIKNFKEITKERE